jgi:hypothetical protein
METIKVIDRKDLNDLNIEVDFDLDATSYASSRAVALAEALGIDPQEWRNPDSPLWGAWGHPVLGETKDGHLALSWQGRVALEDK